MQMRKVDLKENVKVTASKELIVAIRTTDDFTLNARKLLFIAIAQCRMNDTKLYRYQLSIKDFAKYIGVDKFNLYRTADGITDSLLRTLVSISSNEKKGFFAEKYPLFSMCRYNRGVITFELSEYFSPYLLHIRKSFVHVLLSDITRMKSEKALNTWIYIQEKMQGKKPGITDTYKIDVSIEELRKITGTEKTLKKISDFKRKVLDVVVREITDHCGVNASYSCIKTGRKITDVSFVIESLCHINEDDIPQEIKDKVKRFKSKKQIYSDNCLVANS